MAIRGRVVVPGVPSWQRIATSIVAAAGALTLLTSIVFAVVGAAGSSSPWMAPVLFAVMIVFWAPAELWSSWWITVPAVAAAGTLAALLTHRYRLPQSPIAGIALRRRLLRACFVTALICGAWSLAIAGSALLSTLQSL